MSALRINSIGLFIDGGYFEKINSGLRRDGFRPINLHNLINYIQLAIARRYGLETSSCIVTESHYFQGRFLAEETDMSLNFRKRMFEDELIEEDVIFHYKHIHKIGGVNQEKGVDVWFALESYELAQYRDFDFVVLITGDADHEMLARKIKSLKKQVVLLTWNFATSDSTSPALKAECTFHIDLSELVAQAPLLAEILTYGNPYDFKTMAAMAEDAAKIAAELSAKGLVNVAALLAAMVKQNYKVVGKVGIERLMKDSGIESVIIPINTGDYDKFQKIAKQFGVLYAAVTHEAKETGVMHIVSNMNYSAQLNAVMEAMDYAVPEAGKEEKSAKKAKPRAPQEKSSEERGNGLNKATDTTHEKPSVRQRLAALDAMAKEMSRNAPVKQNEKTR